MQPQQLTMACVLGMNGVSVIRGRNPGAPWAAAFKILVPDATAPQKFSPETIRLTASHCCSARRE
jgi:hypothetical protein